MSVKQDITAYVPFYNSADTVRECIAGLRAQTLLPVRIIVIDDGSKDPLPDLGPEIDILRHAGNSGLGKGRNTALLACKTPLIAALDADVVPDPDWLQVLYSFLVGNENAGVGGMLTERFCTDIADHWRAVHMAQHWGNEFIQNPRFLFGSNTLFRVDILKGVGGYDERLKTNNEDRTISEKIYSKGYNLAYVPNACCEHLRHDTPETVLKGFWQWHHAKGLIEGNYDSPSGLIDRIRRVNFGIYDYRYRIDESTGRIDLLALDSCIPWVFCCLDIAFFGRRTGCKVPSIESVYEIGHGVISGLIRSYIPASTGGVESWHAEYLSEFISCLKSFSWQERKTRANLIASTVEEACA